MLGPTASGKSEVGLRIAEQVGGVVLSVDSMQVYRGMDIGTAKPSPEEQARVPHRMIDLVEPEEEYSVAEFQAEARRVIAEEGRTVIVVGGSGLHFRAVVDPLDFPPTDAEMRRELERTPIDQLRGELLAADPDACRRVDVRNPRRLVRAVEILRLSGATPSGRAESANGRRVAAYEPEIPVRAVGLDPGTGLSERVRARLRRMREQGLLEEVRSLAPRLGRTASQAVGYRQLLPVAAGERSEEEGMARAVTATLALARSQRTYFRRDPRIRWLGWVEDPTRLARSALETLEG